MLSNEVELKVVEYLALAYCRIPWGKIKSSKNPHDIFNHRVRAAAKRASIYAFASKLLNYFGLQTQSVEMQAVLDELRLNQRQVLITLTHEHIPLCVRGIIRAKEIKEGRTIKTKGLFDDAENP